MKVTHPLLFALALSGCGDNLAGAPDAGGADARRPDAAPPGPGMVFVDYTFQVDVSPDGQTALFQAFTPEGEGQVVLYDTVESVGRVVTTIVDPGVNVVTGVSDTQVISAYNGVPVDAATWDATRGWVAADVVYDPGCDPNRSGAFDISGDGTVTTGLLWHGCVVEAYRRTDVGGVATTVPLQLLGTPSDGRSRSNRGSVISDDGQVIAGFAANGTLDRTPALWRADGTGYLLAPALDGANPDDAPADPLSINGDGTVIAGKQDRDAWRWTAATGLTILPRPADADGLAKIYATAMNAAGDVIFGGIGDSFGFSTPVAFVWTEATGMRPLIDIVRASGIVLPAGWSLGSVQGASADGTVLIGAAMDPDFNAKSFVLRLPPGVY